VPVYLLFILIYIAAAGASKLVSYPVFQNYQIVFVFLLFYGLLVSYFTYTSSYISRSYKEIGFVHKAFIPPSIGAVAIFIMASLIIYYNNGFYPITYYNLLSIFIFSAFVFSYFLLFIIEYPSILQPKWKAFMPIDPIKALTTVVLIFLSFSLFYTANDLGAVFPLPIWVFAFIGAVFFLMAVLFTYAKAFSGETTLGYWTYLKTDMVAHLVLTFYIISIGVMLWNSLASKEKNLYMLFAFFSLTFYFTATIDIRNLIKGLKISTKFQIFDIIRYGLSILSLFFIVFFLAVLTRGKITSVDIFLARYPFFPLTLIGVFFIFYFSFIRRSHKGFEELMERGAITTLSYFAGLGVFVTVFLMYTRFSGGLLSQFPLFGVVFFGYFAILVADVYSTTTLRVKEYGERSDVIDLLNHVAGHFFRTDVLEEMWDEVVENYKGVDSELEKARFYAPERTFDLGMVNEKAKSAAAVAMLYKMDFAANRGGVPVVPFDDDVKAEIEKLLGEKLLLLPSELAKDFTVDKYYTKLLESTITRINNAIKPFLSLEDYSSLVKNLVAVDGFFKNIIFTEEGVRINLAAELGRKGFLKYLRLYIKGLGDTFPFNRMLLREAVQAEVKARLSLYGFTRADVLNVVPSGVKELDEVLYGGFIKGTSTLFLTEERRAKNDVLFMFISEGLKEGEPGIFATSRVSSKDLLDLFNRVSDGQENLSIIDLYLSTHTDNVVHIPIKKDDRHIISTSLIQVKQAVVAAVKKHAKDVHKRIVLDIYTDLSKYQNTDEILDLVKKQVEGFKRWNVTSIVTLAPDLTNDELERYFDNVIVLSDVATVRIKKLFGGKPKKESFVIWGRYAPMEEPDYSLFFED